MRGVVRAALVALGVVHDALEDASEDVRVDVLPVRLGGFCQRGKLRVAQGQRHRIREQAAVEERNRARSREVTRAHCTEQLAQSLLDVASARAPS